MSSTQPEVKPPYGLVYTPRFSPLGGWEQFTAPIGSFGGVTLVSSEGLQPLRFGADGAGINQVAYNIWDWCKSANRRDWRLEPASTENHNFVILLMGPKRCEFNSIFAPLIVSAGSLVKDSNGRGRISVETLPDRVRFVVQGYACDPQALVKIQGDILASRYDSATNKPFTVEYSRDTFNLSADISTAALNLLADQIRSRDAQFVALAQRFSEIDRVLDKADLAEGALARVLPSIWRGLYSVLREDCGLPEKSDAHAALAALVHAPAPLRSFVARIFRQDVVSEVVPLLGDHSGIGRRYIEARRRLDDYFLTLGNTVEAGGPVDSNRESEDLTLGYPMNLEDLSPAYGDGLGLLRSRFAHPVDVWGQFVSACEGAVRHPDKDPRAASELPESLLSALSESYNYYATSGIDTEPQQRLGRVAAALPLQKQDTVFAIIESSPQPINDSHRHAYARSALTAFSDRLWREVKDRPVLKKIEQIFDANRSNTYL